MVFLLQAGTARSHPDDQPSVIVITFKDKTTKTFANVGYRREIIDNDLLTDIHWFVPTAVITKTDLQLLMTKKIDCFEVGGVKSTNWFLNNFANRIIGYATCLCSMN